MDKPRFVYITYIRSTRERIWQALTDGAITPAYWSGHRIESDWMVGGPIRFFDADSRLVHDDKVLRCEPPALLSYTWSSLRPGFDKEAASRLTITLEQVGPQVKLTLVHDAFAPGGKLLEAVSHGWPAVLSELKTLLETGKPVGISVPPSRPGMPEADEPKPDLLCVTYIAAPANAVWEALTRSASTTQFFFGRGIESDWREGSDWLLRMEDGRVDVKGKVLVADKPRRLRLSWHVEWLETFRDLPATIVEYRIEPCGDRQVKLTLTETLAAPIPDWMREGGRQGWPAILSSLKSLLETGEALRIVMQPPKQPAAV